MKKFKKVVSLCLAVAMATSIFVGCNKNNNKSDSKIQSEEKKVEAPKLNKEAKLRVGFPDNAAVKGFESGASENINQFVDAIREKSGYKNLEWNIIPSVGFQDKLNLMFASGDVMDIICANSMDIFRNYCSQGMLMPLDDLITQFGSQILKIVQDSTWAAVTKEGKKYAIPTPPYEKYEGKTVGNGYLVRQDWMDKLGLKAPKNTDELYTFLKTLKDKNPNGTGTIPLVAPAGNNGDPLSGLGVITAAFGLSVPYIVKDGKIIATDDLYLKDCVEYLAKLFKEELIDKEYIFNKTAQVNEKVASGKAASVMAGYYDVKTHTAALAKTDPNAKLSFLPLVEGKNGLKGYSMPSPVSRYYIIPKNAKYAKESVDLVNTYLKDQQLQEFINFGKEGIHYQKKEGDLVPINPAYDSIIYKILYRMWNGPEIWVINAKLAGYEPGMKSYVAAGDQNIVFNIDSYRPKSEMEVSKSKTLSDLRYEYLAKIINGALPISAFDEYMKKADESGKKEIMKEIEDWYNKEGKAIYELANKK